MGKCISISESPNFRAVPEPIPAEEPDVQYDWENPPRSSWEEDVPDPGTYWDQKVMEERRADADRYGGKLPYVPWYADEYRGKVPIWWEE